MHTHGRHAARLRTLDNFKAETAAKRLALDNFGTAEAAEAYGRLVRMYSRRQNAEV